VCAPLGFKAAGVACGIRKGEGPDLAVIVSEQDANAAGVLTQNRVRAWCVVHNELRLRHGVARAIVCNAGNANACNGELGAAADLEMAGRVLQGLHLKPEGPLGEPILTASTGVIGRAFPASRVSAGIDAALKALGDEDADNEDAARAIMTTDLQPKFCAVEVESRGGTYRIGGIAKGSGMIAPNMATMLAFLTTDADVRPGVLQSHLEQAVDATFNCITVDGDTSTNDMAIILANGASGVRIGPADEGFLRALRLVCEVLAKRIARDGEGATKLVTVRVTDCPGDAKLVARTIAESPLVKTALFGNDPNWGRILAAAGRSGIEFNPEQVSVSLAGHKVFEDGAAVCHDLEAVSEAMKAEEVEILVELGRMGGDNATVWTCDLTYDYVRINAEYTT
jgi:glutamate N-acetyltransferase/amino-acid N-acetyltransferase